MNATKSRAVRLGDLHRGPEILVLPNAWDCVSACLFEQAGFPALATTSGGIAAQRGYPDGQRISRREMLEVVERIAAVVSIPVTADLEAGYGKTPPEVAETVRQAMEIGVVGANLEDSAGPDRSLTELARQTEIIHAVRETAAARGIPFVLNARVDVFLRGDDDPGSLLSQAIERARTYFHAGADCVFPIGLRDRETIARFVREAGGPVNIMAGHGAPGISELEQLGVRRVTFGTGMFRALLPFLRRIAQETRERGHSELLEQSEFSHVTVNRLFP